MIKKAASPLGFFEKWLTLWVFICMIVGVLSGQFIPSLIQTLGKCEVANVNIPVGLLIWAMIIPMLIRINLSELSHVKQYWKGIGITLAINWLIKPFSMALLGWIFIRHVFYDFLPISQVDNYIAGLVILSAAPCTAMVFVWSTLCKGEPHFTLTQVALNDIIMIFAFAPIIGLLLGISNISVPWDTLLFSVLIYILIPFVIAQICRAWIIHFYSISQLESVMKCLHPLSLIALLLMLILLFGFQGKLFIQEPLVVLMLAVPIIIQVYFNSLTAYYLNKKAKESFHVAGPSALIGASNFFELAVATAISLFGFKSGAALATVVGVLVEVPVMLSIVHIVNKTERWYKRKN